MRAIVIKFRNWFLKEIYHLIDIQRLYNSGKITDEEYEYITGVKPEIGGEDNDESSFSI